MSDRSGIDLYQVLGVPRDATAPEIRRAYRRLARQHHPDVNPGPDGTRRFAAVAHAYETLHDPARRADYDHTHPPPAAVTPPSFTARGRPRPAPVPTGSLQQGVLELSAVEAQQLAHRPLLLQDAHGRRIVLPAGTRHGDQITLLYDGHAALLTVRMP